MTTTTNPVRWYDCPSCGIEVETDRPEHVAGVPLPVLPCPECEENMQVGELQTLAEQRDSLDLKIQAQVLRARMTGASWATIGNALGVSKQAAQQRYGR